MGADMVECMHLPCKTQEFFFAIPDDVTPSVNMAEMLVENGEIDAAEERESAPVNLFADTST